MQPLSFYTWGFNSFAVMKQLLECVPNFSEGRDPGIIRAIADSIRSVPGQALLHIDPSPAANRTVMTLAGEPEAVQEAAFRAIRTAANLIDMRRQEGVHPRIGATDVCPMIPLMNMRMEDAVMTADRLAERVAEELGIPVYLYENNQAEIYRKALPDIRRGQYENFPEKMQDPRWVPDYGHAVWNPRTGATVIGARDILIAFNVSLDTDKVEIAETLARRMRERGYWQSGGEGGRLKIDGLLPRVRSIGWYMADYHQAQVSFNILDYHTSSVWRVWYTCDALAREFGVHTNGSELIGLIPLQPLLEIADITLPGNMFKEEKKVAHAIQVLGLDVLKPFDPEEKILEWSVKKHLDIEFRIV